MRGCPVNCPECSLKLRDPSACPCGWTAQAERTGDAVPFANCAHCKLYLPWPSAKQAKSSHRIIGVTKDRAPLCNLCYERVVEPDWREAAYTEFYTRHEDDMWGALIRASYTMRGASKAEQVEFMGQLKAQAARSGGLFRRLPYDKTKREPL